MITEERAIGTTCHLHLFCVSGAEGVSLFLRQESDEFALDAQVVDTFGPVFPARETEGGVVALDVGELLTLLEDMKESIFGLVGADLPSGRVSEEIVELIRSPNPLAAPKRRETEAIEGNAEGIAIELPQMDRPVFGGRRANLLGCLLVYLKLLRTQRDAKADVIQGDGRMGDSALTVPRSNVSSRRTSSWPNCCPHSPRQARCQCRRTTGTYVFRC